MFLAAFFVLGFVAASYGLWSCFLAYQAKSWPSVFGVVISDECRVAGDRVLDRHVHYRYTVGAKEFVSDREHFGLRIASIDCFADLGAGQRVDVHYDPADPGEAVLKPGVYRQGVFDIVVGLAFMAFAVIGIRHERAGLATSDRLNQGQLH